MKEKLKALLAQKSAALKAAEDFINEGKFEEAKQKTTEAKSLTEQIAVVEDALKVQEADAAKTQGDKQAALETENAALKAKLNDPARLPGLGDEIPDPKKTPAPETGLSSAHQLRYGETPAAVKAAIKDLFGSERQYDERREAQMDAFVKYIRLGDGKMKAEEVELIEANYKNMLVTPDVLAREIKLGRSVKEIKATLIEGSMDLGGYLVPEDYRTQMIKRLAGNTVVRSRARVVSTTRDAIEWPRLEGGDSRYTSAVRVSWVDENPANASTAETNPTFGLLRVPIHTVMARTDLSRNLLEDSAFNVLDTLSELFSEATRIDEDEQFLIGVGGGRPLGVLGARSGAEYAPVAGVAREASLNASDVTADGIINLVYAIASQYREGAVFTMSRLAQRNVRKLKDGSGRYLWQDSIQIGQPATLMGYPVAESEALPSITANQYPIIFGNWGGYIIADRVGMSIERVTDSTLVGNNKVAVFLRRRLGGQVAEPWRFVTQQIAAS